MSGHRPGQARWLEPIDSFDPECRWRPDAV